VSLSDHEKHPALQGQKPVWRGIIFNILLAVIKVVVGVVGSSYALVADGIESTMDIFSSFILLFGLRVASKAPDQDHPYGHGKAEPIAAAVVALSLTVAVIMIVTESIENIRTPHGTPAAYTLAILGMVIAIKEGLYRYVSRSGKELGSKAIEAEAQHHRSDMISSSAAFVGITIALIGGKGYESADDWAAIVAAGVIAYNAYHIMMPALAEIMDTAPQGELVNDIKETASKIEGVRDVEKCIVRKMGFEYYVDLHIEVDPHITVFEGHEIAHRVKTALLDSTLRIYDVLIHVEPEKSIYSLK
jgi:cation diffusion facilitator family transporter